MTISLQTLDNPLTTPCDPQVWERNLSALRHSQPAVARWIADRENPGLRPVVALDGFPTYRSESDPPGWFGGTAVPLERARALVDAYYPGDLNATLPCLGAGAELALLLQRLPPLKAVFVFEPDPGMIAAVLRRIDVADDLASLRCIFIRPGAGDALRELLQHRPGLLPPGNILRAWGASDSRLAELRDLCIRTAAEIRAKRAQRVQELLQSPAPPRGGRRIALVAWTSGVEWADAIRAAENADSPEFDARAFVSLGPADVHPLACLERLAEFGPALCVRVAGSPPQLPVAAPVVEWHVAEEPAGPVAPERVHLAASPWIEAALRGASRDARVVPFYWAAPSVEREAAADASGPLVVVASGPGPAIEPPDLPTHRLIWDRMRALLDARDDLDPALSADALVARAERSADLRLPDDVRTELAGRAARALIPTWELRTILADARAVAPVVAVGMGWSLDTGSGSDRSVRDWRTFIKSRVVPRGVVFPHALDPLTPPLLEAAASGWPVAVQRRDARRAAADFGGVLTPGEHLAIFSTRAELRAWLRQLCDQPEPLMRTARRAAAHVRATHSWPVRLAGLHAALLGAADRPRP